MTVNLSKYHILELHLLLGISLLESRKVEAKTLAANSLHLRSLTILEDDLVRFLVQND